MSYVSNFIITTNDRDTLDSHKVIDAFKLATQSNAERSGLGDLFKASRAHAIGPFGPKVMEHDVWLATSNYFSSESLVEVLLKLPLDHLARRVVVFACDQEDQRYRQVWPDETPQREADDDF